MNGKEPSNSRGNIVRSFTNKDFQTILNAQQDSEQGNVAEHAYSNGGPDINFKWPARC